MFVCTNRRPDGNPKGSCGEKGSEALKDRMKAAAKAAGLDGRVRVMTSSCQDVCHLGITVSVWPDGVFYGRVTEADVPEIVERHLGRGEVVERLVIADEQFEAGS